MLWEVATRSKVTEFADHLGDVMSISINPTNQHVFMSGACALGFNNISLEFSGFRAYKATVNMLDGVALVTGASIFTHATMNLL